MANLILKLLNTNVLPNQTPSNFHPTHEKLLPTVQKDILLNHFDRQGQQQQQQHAQ